MTSNLLSVSECIQRHPSSSSSSSQPVVYIDGSWHLSSRNARQEYESGPRIQGAQFFDIDNVATKQDHQNNKNLPHMMPPPKLFARVMDEFGITFDTDIILYGTEDCFSIPRVLYTFKAMGHPADRVKMMNGSLKDWMDAGGPVEWGTKETIRVEDLLEQEKDFEKSLIKYDVAVDAKNVVGMDRITEIVVQNATAQGGERGIIVDARSAGRFVGKEPEPRKGLRGGHMPGAFNVPFDTLLDTENGKKKTLRSREELISIFQDAGVNVYTVEDIICSCGSGVTACWVALALEECGRDPMKTFVYDGSWIEWASDEKNPVVKEEESLESQSK